MSFGSDYWDGFASDINRYHLQSDVAKHKKKETLSTIRDWYGSLSHSKILKTDLFEEAFGGDDILYDLSSHNNSVFGIDISGKIVNRAMERNSVDLDLRRANVMDIPFEDNYFDLVISNSTLDHLNFQDVLTSLKEIKRVMKPSGNLMLTLDNKENPLYLLGYILNKHLGLLNHYQERCYSRRQILKLLSRFGLKSKEIKGLIKIPAGFNRILLTLEEFNQRINKEKVNKYVGKFNRWGSKLDIKSSWFIAVDVVMESS